MTETKFTPGPWTADLGEAFHIRDASKGSLAMMKFLKGVGGLGGRREAGEVAANARLIAAAPKLYEATEPFDELFTHHAADAPEWNDNDRITVQLSIGVLRAIKAARAQARGEQS